MKILELLVLLLTIPAAMVGLPLLALRGLRWVRANRGEATGGLAMGFLSDALDSWASDSTSSHGADHSDAGHDHHH